MDLIEMQLKPRIRNNLLSEEYRDDGKSMVQLNELQRRSIAAFLSDSRITYSTVEHCLLCENSDFEIIANKDKYGIPLETAICNHCGLIFSQQQLSEDSAKIFYGEYYRKIYEGVPEPTLDHGYYKHLYTGKMVPKVPRFIGQDSTVLELGCGGGWNLLPFLKKGVRHVGYDYDGYMIKFGRERYGLSLREGGLETAQVDQIRADFVIISHVLEHINDPITFMRGVSAVLKEGGLVRITVPCLDCLGYFGGSGIGYRLGMALQNAHTYTFSEKTLHELLLIAGFDPVVLVRGFCLARTSRNKVGRNKVDIVRLRKNRAEDTRRVLASSERYFRAKDIVYNLTPKRIRKGLDYLNLLARPREVLLYAYTFHKSHV
jgi:SAM-dependent methyltransferase